MFKRLEYPRICAQLLHASSWRIESICWFFEVEIKTADLYSLHKQRYCILHLFTCRVLAFSLLPVGTYIKAQTRNLHEGDAKTCALIILPRFHGVDIWHSQFHRNFFAVLVWQIIWSQSCDCLFWESFSPLCICVLFCDAYVQDLTTLVIMSL